MLAVAAGGLPSPEAIFARAQRAWVARVVPAYEAFRIACEQTFLEPKCGPGDDVQFIVRMSDGRTYATTVETPDDPSIELMRGGYIMGAADTPLGFYRRVPSTQGYVPASPPPNLAADPMEPTIATVTAVDRSYDLTYIGEESLEGQRCYHLTLKPLRDPDAYPLRELWVEASDFQVVRLTYVHRYEDRSSPATVHFAFARVGPEGIWAIVHIDAGAPEGELFGNRVDRVSSDLRDITFPASEPADYFDPRLRP